jgi:hypothetical protein
VTPNSHHLVPTYESAALKAVIVHRQLCIAYAGTPVEAAVDAIRRISALGPDVRIEEIGEHLLATHRQRGGAVDFLIVALEPNALGRVSDGRVTWDLETAWIGDAEVFEAFQEVFVGGVPRLDFPEELWGEDITDEFLEGVAASRAELDRRLAVGLGESEARDLAVADRATRAMQSVVQSSRRALVSPRSSLCLGRRWATIELLPTSSRPWLSRATWGLAGSPRTQQALAWRRTGGSRTRS